MSETTTADESIETPEPDCTWCKGGPLLAAACFVIAGIFLLIGIDFLRGIGESNDTSGS